MVVRKLLYFFFIISDRSIGKNREVEDLNNVINSLDLKNVSNSNSQRITRNKIQNLSNRSKTI